MRNKYRGEDIRARLHGTIIRYKNKPYSCIAEDNILHLVDMETRAIAVKVRPDDQDLDISSMDLGYINISSPAVMAVYCARGGHRRYKQGIDLNTLHLTPLQSKEYPRVGVTADSLFCKGFVDAYEGKFPKWTDARKLITENKCLSMALSRDVAAVREKDILKFHVKNEEVGWTKLGGKEVVTVPRTLTSWVDVFHLEQIDGLVVREGA